MPTVSIVIPTYNRSSVLMRAIDSVLAQTYENFEIVVVDDCSTDDTVEALEEYDDDRIRYIQHDKNQGACAARNTGIKQSNGQYVAFLDSDDEWDLTKLAKQVDCMENTSDCVGVVYTGYRVKRSDIVELGQVPSKRGDIHRAQLAKDWVSPTSAVMVKSECFDEVGIFDTGLAARQDYDMWLRLSYSYEFEYVKEPLVTLHTNRNNRITDNIDARMNAHQILLKRIRARIVEFDSITQHQILSSQYFNIGRYLQRNGQDRRAAKFFILSVAHNIFNFTSWLCLLLLLLHLNPDSGILLKMKNSVKKIKFKYNRLEING
ncbi:glycosyltransferase [Halorubrum sp. PV6]|uniref:glycosyltransferase family 2 protein n=1 Tax=Halorubrum sp. PV6 TaxID=634157 RepID=UPI001304A79E|nr:glycosyltransferase [Halorubrum sp. PV6]